MNINTSPDQIVRSTAQLTPGYMSGFGNSFETEALPGAFFSPSKLAGPGFDDRSECRNTFSSRYFAGFHRRNASICCAGEPGAT